MRIPARFFPTLALLALATTSVGAQQKLKVYISVDMEGIAGVVSNAQAGGADFRHFVFQLDFRIVEDL